AMKKQGFASMYMVYSFFIIFIMMMLTVLMTNNYKKLFLNSYKNDIKEELQNYHLETKEDLSPIIDDYSDEKST
ncbi:MAG: hypothetical protein K2J20_02570, partial [Bacilli bacterium]|nr:hypothetical protein [Bacilli bacterium]